MLSWQISRDIVVDLNPSFKNIPFNDAGFARIFQTETLTWFLDWFTITVLLYLL
ncbi:hypothetical protein JTS93_02995 [Clostridium botulinum]|nr:hypothetical protein [Clostridium botulinum]MCS4522536.1 hypothetical protein [Clostridium botulinum]